MRALFIAVVLIATLLTFYSALWYKSETIEQDITKRVTEDLTTANAKDVAIDVDGRHVTLSGVVYDEATEASYLDTADNTYGALGPIDGLTYVAGGGFVKAVKTADGITLRGSVASEDARTALVEAATASTDGAVDDQLTIGAADGDWQGEAGYGLAQMGALSAGTLAVAPGSYSLSGTAADDDSDIKAAFADRDNWQTFTSSPAVGADMSARIAALESDVSGRDTTIAGLTGERDGLAGDLQDVTSERNALSAQRKALAGSLGVMTLNRDAKQKELDDLRANLNANQTEVAALISARDAAEAGVAERDVTIEGLNSRIAGMTERNTALVAELDAQKAALSGDQSDMQAQIDALTGQVNSKDAQLTDLQKRLLGANGKVAEGNNTIAGLEGDVANKDLELEDLRARLTGAQGTVAEGNKTIAARDNTIANLRGLVGDRNKTIADLEGQISTASAAVPAEDPRIAPLTAAVAAQKAQAQEMGKKVDDLTGVVAERDATIAALRNRPTTGQSSAQLAEQCSVRASSVLENAQINFRTATAQIDRGSVETLERLTGIALACVGDGLAVEIGGHTDDRGSDANNQALSERRAQAILAFMAERGVPTAGLKAVGYGEARPIGDNTTNAGRAANRRISFDWQAR